MIFRRFAGLTIFRLAPFRLALCGLPLCGLLLVSACGSPSSPSTATVEDAYPPAQQQAAGQVGEGPSGGQFLTHLGHHRVGGIVAGAPPAFERAVARVEVHDHVAVLLVLDGLEGELPRMGHEFVHARIIRSTCDPVDL